MFAVDDGPLRVMRRPIVGVMGSGRDAHDALAAPLGAWIAQQGWHLLTGGGGGVMESVTRAFVAFEPRLGLAIGVLPGDIDAQGRFVARPGYPNDSIELPIRTHLPASGDRGTQTNSRNHINVLSAKVIVALPGGAGTRSEVELAVRYGRPVVAFLGDAPSPYDALGVPVARDLDEAARFVRAHVV